MDNTIIDGATGEIIEQQGSVNLPALPNTQMTPEQALDLFDRWYRVKQQFIKTKLKPDKHYGVIPGTGNKPTLYLAGAELVLNLHGYTISELNCLEKIEDWDKGRFFYRYEAVVTDGQGRVRAKGIGSCSNQEDKYAYRWLFENQVPAELDKTQFQRRSTRNGGFQYRVPNANYADLINVIDKMSQKRSIVQATKLATGISDDFTVDLEDEIEVDRALSPEEANRRHVLAFADSLGFDADWLREFFKRAQLAQKDLKEKLGTDRICKLIAAEYTNQQARAGTAVQPAAQEATA